MNMRIQIQKLRNDAHLPYYATPQSAGCDLIVPGNREDKVFIPFGRSVIKLGFAFSLPEGWEAQIRPRSGISLKGLPDIYGERHHNVSLVIGTIDADYRGEVGVIIHNREPGFYIEGGCRIAQMVISPIAHANWVLCDELPESSRGQSGFGHSGLFAPCSP